MDKTKNILLIIAAIVIVGCLLYIPGLTKLGLYRDDWNNFYNLTVRGPEKLIEAYQADRPADGYLITLLYRLFGVNIRAYFIWNLCCRIFGSVFLALSLLVIWPRTPKMAALAGLLAVVFPGFLQQIDGIAYIPHQTAMLCFLISLWLTALACEPGQKDWNVLYTFLSMIFAFAYMMLMEYYVGMEIYRIGLIYMMNREKAGKGKPGSFFQSLLSYIPYLIPVAGFLVWRVFFYQPERAGTDFMTEIIRPILAHPRHELIDLVVRTLKSVWKLFAGVWTIPAYNLINGLSMKAFMNTFIPAFIIFAVGQVFLFLMHRRKTDESVADAKNESAQWLWYGLICGAVAVLPLIIAGRDINFSASLDRFSWPGMIGAILFLAGLLGSLRDRSLRNALTMAAILLSVFVQCQNQVNYINQWKSTRDYWQQLMWRAPGIKEGTTIVSGGSLLVEEDYDVFAPASMIYYPNEPDWAPVGAEVLNTNTIRDVILQRNSSREVREIYVEKNYDKLLAISKPSETGCLRVINGENPIYSGVDWTKIPEIGSYSKLSQIITDPEKPASLPFFLSEELEHNWCYYYEKMELALQMNDAEGAAALADNAKEQNLKAGDSVEWIPVIEAYAQTGRMAEAMEIVEQLREDEWMEHNACRYFLAKEDTEVYGEINAVLCSWMPEEDKTGSEVNETVETNEPDNSAETSDAGKNGDEEKLEKNIIEPTEEIIEIVRLQREVLSNVL